MERGSIRRGRMGVMGRYIIGIKKIGRENDGKRKTMKRKDEARKGKKEKKGMNGLVS